MASAYDLPGVNKAPDLPFLNSNIPNQSTGTTTNSSRRRKKNTGSASSLPGVTITPSPIPVPEPKPEPNQSKPKPKPLPVIRNINNIQTNNIQGTTIQNYQKTQQGLPVAQYVGYKFREAQEKPTLKQEIMREGGYTYAPNVLIKRFSKSKTGQVIGGGLVSAGTGLPQPVAREVAGEGLAGSQYFVPVYGEVLAVGQAGETILRPSKYLNNGWRGALNLGGSLVIGGASGRSLFKSLNKVNKIDVKFVSQDLKAMQVNDKVIVESQTGAIIKENRRLINKDFKVALNSKVELNILNDLQEIKSYSQGVISEYKGINPLTSKGVYTKPKPFVGASKGIAKEESVILTNGVTEKEIRATTVLFGGKVQQGSKISANFLDDLTLKGWKLKGNQQPTRFVGGGFSTPLDEYRSLFYGKSGDIITKRGRVAISKTGTTTSLGIIKNAPKELSGDSSTLFLKFSKDKQQLAKEITKSIDQATISKASLTQPNKFKSKLKPVSALSGLNYKSPYYGTGQYEQTQEVSYNKVFSQSGLMGTRSDTKFITLSLPKSNFDTSTRSSTRTRQSTKSFQDVVNKDLAIERLNQPTQQKENQRNKQLQREIQRQQNNTKQSSRMLQLSKSAYKYYPKINISLPKFKGSGFGTETGYKAYTKRGGKTFEVAGLFTKGDALRVGELTALKSLTAKFGIKATPFRVYGKSNDYQVNTRKFRSFRIQNRKAIPLTNEFIQRRGQRLSNFFETAEIQRSRRR
jgi:hypothetical protein